MVSILVAWADKCNKSFPKKNEPLALPTFSTLCRAKEVSHIWKADWVETVVNFHSNPLVCLGHLSLFMYYYYLKGLNVLKVAK